MKKAIFLTFISLLAVSCQNEGMKTDTIMTVESLQNQEMKNFEDAVKSIGKAGMKYIEPNGQLSKEGIEILLPVSKKLIIESGGSEANFRSTDEKSIINQGFAAYSANLVKYHKITKANY
ncbi:hypothetical protein P0M11_11280 [Kaistella sp. PBT33-4]|uniref:hypothetical protein n=1 Tax=Kaistella sp. PBT33-4 TaxID=3032000 RepID=UPI0023D89EB7|nr:hypothetical protein [Kaistella sp. PBT33-4]MDF0720579.1 hypothetical protein [Kaistella sp. PBT33-4]